MAKRGKNYSLYLNDELVKKFERIQAHLGYGVSQSIANLIEVRFTEIEENVTRRQVMSEVRENLTALKEGNEEIAQGITAILMLLGSKENG